MTSDDFEKDFDEGKDIMKYLDVSRARRGKRPVKRVNVDFPDWMVLALDIEAGKIGVTRQSLIKMWLAERLDPKDYLGPEFED